MDQLPLTIGNYRLLEKIEEGRWSTIYRAEEINTQAKVAVKLLHPDLKGSEAYIDQMKRIGRKDLLNILSTGSTTEGRVFVAYELMQGQTIKDEVRQKRALSSERALGIITELVENFILLDEPYQVLKLNHVFLQKEPNGRQRTVLLGFGELDLWLANNEPTRCGPGPFLGELLLYSAERIQEQYTKITNDIYSLGALWYYMLTGEPPYHAEIVFQLIAQIVQNPIPDIQQKCPALPTGHAHVLQRMTHKQESERYQSFAELRRDIHSLSRNEPTPTGKSYFFPNATLEFRKLPSKVTARLLEMQEKENDPLRLQEHNWRLQLLRFFWQPRVYFWYLHPTYLVGRYKETLRVFSWAYLQEVGFMDDAVSLHFIDNFRRFDVIQRSNLLQPPSQNTIHLQYNGSTQKFFETVATFAEKSRNLNYQKQAHSAPEADLFSAMLDWRR
jgi:serine/threonine protein kinase